MAAVPRPLDLLKQIQKEVAGSVLAPERLKRLQDALADYGRGTYFDITFGEQESIRATVRSLARYLAGLESSYVVADAGHSQDYFKFIRPVVNTASAWDETDRRIVTLYLDPKFAQDSISWAKDEGGAYWRRTFLSEVVVKLAEQEPAGEVLDQVLRVSTPLGLDRDYVRRWLFVEMMYGFIEERQVTSIGRYAVSLFRADPAGVLADSVAAKRCYILAHSVFLQDRVLFDQHRDLLRHALVTHGATVGLIHAFAATDALAYADLVKELVGIYDPTDYLGQFHLAQLLHERYPDEQALFRRCALGSLEMSTWDHLGGFPERCAWVAGHFPEEVLDPAGPLRELYPSTRSECAHHFLLGFKQRALPFALNCLLTKPPHFNARDHSRYVVRLFEILSSYDLTPHREAITRFFARKNINKQVRMEAMALLNGEPLVIKEDVIGPLVTHTYALDRYGAELHRSWLAECLSVRANLPQPISRITAGRRDEELEICVLTVEDDARSSIEIPVASETPAGYPSHIDDLGDEEGANRRMDHLLRDLLKTFCIRGAAEVIAELGWNGALARLRTYEACRAVHQVAADLREQGIVIAAEVQCRVAGGDDETGDDLAAAEQAVANCLDFLTGRPLLTREFSRLAYLDLERQAWLIRLAGHSSAAPSTASTTAAATATTGLTDAEAREVWDRIVAELPTRRSAMELVWPSSLPWVITSPYTLTLDGGTVLRALRQALRDGIAGAASPIIRLLSAVVAADSRDALAVELARTWTALERKPADRRWLVEAAALLGGPQTVLLLGSFLWEKRSDSAANAAYRTTLDLLSSMDGLVAVHEVFGAQVMPSRYPNRRNEASEALIRMAARRGTTFEALVVACVPPAPTGAHAERVMQVQSQLFEQIMVNGYRWHLTGFQQAFLAHPVPAYLLAGVVLATFAADGRLAQSFVAREGRFLDPDGGEVSPDPGLVIGIAHPIELDDAGLLRLWQGVANRWGFYQSFAQLGRSLHRMTPPQLATNLIQDFRRYDRDWLHQQEWIAGKDDQDHMSDADYFRRDLVRDGKRVELKLDGNGSIWGLVMGHAPLEYGDGGYHIVPGDPSPFSSLHPVSRSEILYSLLGRPWVPHIPPPPFPPVPSSSFPVPLPTPSVGTRATPLATRVFPYAERAPTGRATCLVCRQRIAQDSLRVAVERQIDTAEFKGAGAGYMHAACVAGYPPLATLTNRDAVIRRNSQIAWP